MNPNQAGRRSFLCNIGILVTGVAFGGVKNNLLSSSKTAYGLIAEWECFCKQNNGNPFKGVLPMKKEIVSCKGHEHKDGRLIYFSEAKIIAQPTWIYWADKPAEPSDVVLNLYKGKDIISLNQFELKGLLHLSKQVAYTTQDLFAMAFQKDENAQRVLFTQAHIIDNKAEMAVLKRKIKTLMSYKENAYTI